MTDKETIIDGVDVRGCRYHKHFVGENSCNAYLTCPYCKGNPDCYYKQLQRQEQELEKHDKENN